MGFLSIIETFFFISLGITIILVALLVYHFKQRMSTLEQKYETLFDIVAGTAKQLTNIQSTQDVPIQHMNPLNEMYVPWNHPSYLAEPNNSPVEYENMYFHNEQPHLPSNYINHSTQNELEADDETDDGMSESEVEYSDEDFHESDVENSTVNSESSDEDAYSDDETIGKQKDHSKGHRENVSVESDPLHHSGTKIIHLNETDCTISLDEMEDTSHGQFDEETSYEPVQDIQIDHLLDTAEDESPIIVKKIIVEELSENIFLEKKSSKELYKKMSLSNLKATVISKGLCSDPSKMKKPELLQLLEDS